MSNVIRSVLKWARRAPIGIAGIVVGLIGLNVYDTYVTRLPSCDHQKEVVIVQSLRHLSQSLRDETLKQLPGLADRGSAFSSGCAGYGAHQRFVTAARAGSRWVVAYEQGGIGYGVNVLTFVQQNTGSFVITSHRLTSSETFCAEVNARLRNEPVPADRRNILDRGS